MTIANEFRKSAGLCGTCAHALIRPTRRGTTYLRCGLAAEDGYPKYPQLPKRDCMGGLRSQASTEQLIRARNAHLENGALPAPNGGFSLVAPQVHWVISSSHQLTNP